MGCRQLLECVLGWEAQDAELASRHFLTVAAFNLQHPAQYTDEANAILRTAFIDVVENRATPADIRRRMGVRFAGARRVLKPASAHNAVARRWKLTVADVYAAGSVQGAAVRVNEWAASIREDIAAEQS